MLLPQVPKMLGSLRRDWSPQAYIVSFKLETDDAILLSKVAPEGHGQGLRGFPKVTSLLAI